MMNYSITKYYLQINLRIASPTLLPVISFNKTIPSPNTHIKQRQLSETAHHLLIPISTFTTLKQPKNASPQAPILNHQL